VRKLEIGAQFPDSKNVQRNIEIAQIPKLRGTYTCSKFLAILNLAIRRQICQIADLKASQKFPALWYDVF